MKSQYREVPPTNTTTIRYDYIHLPVGLLQSPFLDTLYMKKTVLEITNTPTVWMNQVQSTPSDKGENSQ